MKESNSSNPTVVSNIILCEVFISMVFSSRKDFHGILLNKWVESGIKAVSSQLILLLKGECPMLGWLWFDLLVKVPRSLVGLAAGFTPVLLYAILCITESFRVIVFPPLIFLSVTSLIRKTSLMKPWLFGSRKTS